MDEPYLAAFSGGVFLEHLNIHKGIYLPLFILNLIILNKFSYQALKSPQLD